MILHFIICIYVFQSSLSSPILYDSEGEYFFFYLLNNRHFFLSVHLMPMKWFNWRKENVYFDSSVLEHYQVCGQEYFRSILFLYKLLHVQFFHWLVSLQLVEEIKSIHLYLSKMLIYFFSDTKTLTRLVCI